MIYIMIKHKDNSGINGNILQALGLGDNTEPYIASKRWLLGIKKCIFLPYKFPRDLRWFYYDQISAVELQIFLLNSPLITNYMHSHPVWDASIMTDSISGTAVH